MSDINITPALVVDSPEKYQPENIESNVIIYFRPAKDWLGKDYGFDWLREKDYNTVSPNAKGDANLYEDTISKHYRKSFEPDPKPEERKTESEKEREADRKAYDAQNPYGRTIGGKPYLLEERVNNYEGTFVNDPENFRMLQKLYKYHHIVLKDMIVHDFDNVGFTPYYCAWMSIYPDPNKEVKLSLVAEALDDNMPDSYELEYDEEYFDISLTKEADLTKLTKGVKKGVEDAITFKCIKEFDEDQIVSIYSYKGDKKRLAGRMYVWSNEAKKRKKANIISVIVETKKVALSSGVYISTTSTSRINVTKELNAQYLRQALVELKDEEIIELNLSTDKHFQPPATDGSGGHYYHASGIVGYYTTSAIWSAEKNRFLYEKTPEGYIELGEYLYDRIKESLKAKGLDENKYENYSRLYYLDQGVGNTNGTSFKALGGYSDIRSKAIVLENGADANTVTHEILHALNLMHSFNNKEYQPSSKHCFRSKTTDNIMDYSHLASVKIPMNCLWKWQWEIANRSVMPNGAIKNEQQLKDEHIIIPPDYEI